ncbi:MAG: isoleucine--tRNA ligase [Candidatus Auribacterota bacterium]|jgi:isoleucyl-tRNA synthetase|nr:isoleucine--tRNA ligase [Candidatus Auribacterota bacterium]
MTVEYKKTINLPQTDFPMKANLAQKELEIISQWDQSGINDKIFNHRAGCDQFILHDGPPYANGHIHIGHALNKILKDIIVKYKSMCGYHVPYVPGWDCHGLPVEHQLFKELGLTKHQIDQVKFRGKARKYAMKFVKIQCEEFKRLGVFGEWDDPYLTMSNLYEATIARLFGDLYLKGYIYKGLKPIYWCGACETALAEAEVEYDDHKSPSIYVAFKITDGKDVVSLDENASFVIWTTTPWTLPANLAIAVKPDFEYVLIQSDKGNFIIASELADTFAQTVGIEEYKKKKSWQGIELEGILTKHPFMERTSVIVMGDHVTLEQGTGCVHIAPGHGQEDYEVGLKYGLDIISPVADDGSFYGDLPLFGGKKVFEANSDIIDHLKQIGALLFTQSVSHSYPHCWRCKQPVIFRATEQWFINVDGNNMRNEALSTIRSVNWIPAVGEKRITSMVENRPDWCLSRQRYWGVPIPVLYCKKCRSVLLTAETVDTIEKAFLKDSSDAWFFRSVEDLVGSQKCVSCGHTEFSKETDIIDVWFDSGVSHQAVMSARPNLRYPADLYLEGSDQHRGWFQSSLLTAIGCCGSSPFKTVLTHGFVVDGEGRKMSKSLGNVVSPHDIIKEYGADILRLWVSSVDYTGDVRISQNILSQLIDAYRRIRNTFKYLLGNLYDFNPKRNRVPFDNLLEIDRYALNCTIRLSQKVTELYESYEFYKIFHSIHQFCSVEMSAIYLDILKDHMYCHAPDDIKRRSSQTVLYEILVCLMHTLAPILTFTTEEVFSYFRQMFPDCETESIHLSEWPEMDLRRIDTAIDEKWQLLLQLRTEVQRVLEHFRKEKTIGTSLEASVVIYAGSETMYNLLRENNEVLKEIFIVSEVFVSNTDESDYKWFDAEKIENIKILIKKADGKKCVRCWNYRSDVGTDKKYTDICARCVKAINQFCE